MSDSDFVTSSIQKIRVGEVAANRPNSEAINQKIAGTVNALADNREKVIEISHSGYFSNANIFRDAPIRITNTSEIVRYELSVLDSGSSGETAINFFIYNDAGSYVGNLFFTDPMGITAANNTCLVGYDVDAASSYTFELAAHTTDPGTLNITTLNAGYVLLPFVQTFATSARSLRFRLYIREQ